jgi:hypothetical protein
MDRGCTELNEFLKEYDWELLEMEDEYEEERLLSLQNQQDNERVYDSSFSLYETMRNGASDFNAWKDNLNLDPWAVFEDFFFQESTMGEEPQGNEDCYSGDKAYGHQRYHEAQSRQAEPPPRVSEQTIYRGFDPQFGAKVYTVMRREDYIRDERDSNGKYLYRVFGQDFISGKTKSKNS